MPSGDYFGRLNALLRDIGGGTPRLVVDLDGLDGLMAVDEAMKHLSRVRLGVVCGLMPTIGGFHNLDFPVAVAVLMVSPCLFSVVTRVGLA